MLLVRAWVVSLVVAAAAMAQQTQPADVSQTSPIPVLELKSLRASRGTPATDDASGSASSLRIISAALLHDGRFHSVQAQATLQQPDSPIARPGSDALRLTLHASISGASAAACDVRLRETATRQWMSVAQFEISERSRPHTLDVFRAQRFLSQTGELEIEIRLIRRGPFTAEIAPPRAILIPGSKALASRGEPLKRLLHFQAIGFSSDDRMGFVSPRVCTPRDGWRPHVASLQKLIARLGPKSFDWWGHRNGGVWPDVKVQLGPKTDTKTLFEQMDIARRRFPALVQLDELATFTRRHDINMFGYIGFPRCDESEQLSFTREPAHCDVAQFDRWYGEFVRYGFRGVGHDWTGNLPEGSAVLEHNFPWLRDRGIEPFIEAVPTRAADHLLGQSVVAVEDRWIHTARHPEQFFTEQEINDAGGRTIHLVLHPPEAIRSATDTQQWRFQTALTLLREGKTVAVPLDQLMRAGHPVERLVEASRRIDR